MDLAAVASILKSASQRRLEAPPFLVGSRRLLIAIDLWLPSLPGTEQVEPFLLTKGSSPAPNSRDGLVCQPCPKFALKSWHSWQNKQNYFTNSGELQPEWQQQ